MPIASQKSTCRRPLCPQHTHVAPRCTHRLLHTTPLPRPPCSQPLQLLKQETCQLPKNCRPKQPQQHIALLHASPARICSRAFPKSRCSCQDPTGVTSVKTVCCKGGTVPFSQRQAYMMHTCMCPQVYSHTMQGQNLCRGWVHTRDTHVQWAQPQHTYAQCVLQDMSCQATRPSWANRLGSR